jgi:citrate lyase subunit beta/citryl-CoA lyase
MGFLPANSGGVKLDFSSKLESMYGQSTRELLLALCSEAGVEHGTLFVEDKGAYPFVLRSRLESLLQQVLDDSGLRLPNEASLSDGLPPVEPKRMRRSRLYLPGNEAKYMINAALHQPDGIILDLEDSVAPASKFDARAMVRHALHCLDFGACERMVRINQGEMGMEDLQYLSDAPFHMVLIPKVETPEEIHALEPLVAGRDLLFMPIIESAKGVMNAEAIAQASPRIVALTLGLEDLTADLGVVKTPGGEETAFACSWVIHVAKAHGLQAIDSVYGNIGDEEGLRNSLREAKAKGFEGKGCVHPRQIRIVHDEFAPTAAEIDRACKIALAFESADAKGLGVVSLGSKMIDPPVVKRALRLVGVAIQAGLLSEDWRSATN